MLSENLTSLRTRIAKYRDTGLQMSPAAVECMEMVLAQAIDDARALEGGIAPNPYRLQAPTRFERLMRRFDVIEGGRS